MARQKKLERKNAPVILSEKAQRRAKRERRAYFRERYACSGHRLIKLQQEDPDSFYIGFVGTNRAGRAQALVAVEAYLRRATELKVAKHHKGDANIKLVDAGNMRLSDMGRKDERKLALLRRCDLLVHTVRCFDLFEPKPYKPRRGEAKAEVRRDDYDEEEAKEAARILLMSNLGGGVEPGVADGEAVEEKIDWPLSPTPLEDVRGTRAEMAYADLQFIEERQKTNHTKWFWRNRSRALNEKAAISLVVPVLEDAYAVGGELKPVGLGFRESCLSDAPGRNGTTMSRSKRRAAIEEIGLLTPKPVVYVANVPPEAVTSTYPEDDESKEKHVSESTEAIGRVALAHADTVVGLDRDYGVPVVVGCLRNLQGQNALGAAVFKAIPRDFLSRDPKLRKAANSAASKAKQRVSAQQQRRPARSPTSKKPAAGPVAA
eukprot:g3809.t1